MAAAGSDAVAQRHVKVVVFGATGVVGRAAAARFAEVADVVAVSRRAVDLPGVVHVPLDLADDAASVATIGGRAFAGTTHVVYAALQESPDLVAGWHDRELMARNERMFRNAVGTIARVHGDDLEHVSVLQGGKAYGLHLGHTPVPAKERTPRVPHENFYFLQEDALRQLAASASWSWTILRPPPVFGASFGSPMNLLPAIGAYAALQRERGEALRFPGGEPGVHEAVDARLLADALVWAAEASAARNEIFNVTNGDVYSWPEVWPAIAEALDMEVGAPQPQRLAETMPPQAEEWAQLVDRHQLRSPSDLGAFVGGSWQYADMLLGAAGGRRPLPGLLSTVKIRQAGFAPCMDTEDMFRDWFSRFRERRLLP